MRSAAFAGALFEIETAMNHARLLAALAGLLLCLSAAINSRAGDIKKDGIWALSMSGDCRFLLGQPSLDHYVVLNSATLEQVSPAIELEHSQAAALTPDGSRVALSDNRAKLSIFDTRSGKLISTFVMPVPLKPRSGGDLDVRFLTYSHDGQEIVVVTHELIVILNAATGKEITRIDSPEIWEMPFEWAELTPDKNQILTAYQTMHPPSLWDAHTGKLLRTFDDPAGRQTAAISVHISPDGKLEAAGEEVFDDATKGWIYLLRVRECQSGRIITQLEFETNVRAVAFSPDGKQIAAADRMARVFDVLTGKSVTTGLGNGMMWDDKVRDLAFSPDGKYLMSCAPTGFTMVWDVRTQQLRLKVGEVDRFIFAGFASVGHVLITGEANGFGRDVTHALIARQLPE